MEIHVGMRSYTGHLLGLLVRPELDLDLCRPLFPPRRASPTRGNRTALRPPLGPDAIFVEVELLRGSGCAERCCARLLRLLLRPSAVGVDLLVFSCCTALGRAPFASLLALPAGSSGVLVLLSHVVA